MSDKYTKIKNKLKDDKYVSDLIKDFYKTKEESFKIFNLSFKIEGAPESYARERKGRGKHFYNPKGDKMTEIRKQLKESMNKDTLEYLTKIFNSETAEYYVELELRYYIPIQQGSSIKEGVLKELGLIRPASRPDIDNYDKFILDTLHEVAYGDDSHVISVHPGKWYSLKPRTEIGVRIEIRKE